MGQVIDLLIVTKIRLIKSHGKCLHHFMPEHEFKCPACNTPMIRDQAYREYFELPNTQSAIRYIKYDCPSCGSIFKHKETLTKNDLPYPDREKIGEVLGRLLGEESRPSSSDFIIQ